MTSGSLKSKGHLLSSGNFWPLLRIQGRAEKGESPEPAFQISSPQGAPRGLVQVSSTHGISISSVPTA